MKTPSRSSRPPESSPSSPLSQAQARRTSQSRTSWTGSPTASRNVCAGANGDHPVYKSLAERLERIRLNAFSRSQDSIDYLSQIFVLAADLTNAENAEDESGEAGLDVLDPNVGALTQIFEEYKPESVPVIVGDVVRDIDAIVKAVSFSGWSETQRGDKLVRLEVRKVLKKYELHRIDGLFDDAYNYIAANY